MPREMTIEDIERVRQVFVDAAARARKPGLTAWKSLGSGGYLITRFLSPGKKSAHRRYGGSFETGSGFQRK
ncbi:MAG: hypothetical protein R2861_05675 [Desulfobacterales bacterium]